MNCEVYQSMPAKHYGEKRFIITLNADSSGDIQIRSCEVTSHMFRNRTSFAAGATLEQVFCPELAHALRFHFQKLRKVTEILSLPTFLLEIPGLTLSGMDIMATKLKEAGTNIIVRFKTFLGGINRAFSQSIGFDDPVRDPAADLAANVICDVALPLLDICSSAELGVINLTDELSDFSRSVCKRSNEIRFQTELLKRYVAQQARQAAKPDLSETLRHLRKADASARLPQVIGVS